MTDLFIRAARPVAHVGPGTREPIDVSVVRGRIDRVGPSLVPHDAQHVVEAEGRWVMPGLWDQHVHLSSWVQHGSRVDVSAARSAEEAAEIVRGHLDAPGGPGPGEAVVGVGHRSASWPTAPTASVLDVVTGSRPVVLISGDGHHGWLNSAAMSAFGLPHRATVFRENEWFPIAQRLPELPGIDGSRTEAYRRTLDRAAALGVVGIVDLEQEAVFALWPGRFDDGLDLVRVRTATYADTLDEVIAAGLRTHDVIGSNPLLTMGPLKIISDGSLHTRSAFCCQPYADASHLDEPYGSPNLSADALLGLMSRARAHGLEVAVHAIGDAALARALDAFDRSGAHGSVEHAQLITDADIGRFADLGIRASMQPAHLLDDRDVAAQCWPDRVDRCFRFRSLRDAGVDVVLGSDAPVSPLDPWQAMAAAVHRSDDDRAPWNPAESLSVAEALTASVDGQRVQVGARGDLTLLDADPLLAGEPGAVAARLRHPQVATTVVAGRVTYDGGAVSGP